MLFILLVFLVFFCVHTLMPTRSGRNYHGRFSTVDGLPCCYNGCNADSCDCQPCPLCNERVLVRGWDCIRHSWQMVLGSVHIVAHVSSNFFVEGCTVSGCPETEEVRILSSSSTKRHGTRGKGIKKKGHCPHTEEFRSPLSKRCEYRRAVECTRCANVNGRYSEKTGQTSDASYLDTRRSG